MVEETDRLALPLIAAGQAQKEIFHNEALSRIDILLCGSVISSGLDTPPASPLPGECWIVGPSPTGAWTGEAGAVAGWTAAGWRFIAPRAGMSLWDEAAGGAVTHDGSDWVPDALLIGGVQVVGPQRPAIADPSGGATIDVQARTAVSDILASLRAHGLIAP